MHVLRACGGEIPPWRPLYMSTATKKKAGRPKGSKDKKPRARRRDLASEKAKKAAKANKALKTGRSQKTAAIGLEKPVEPPPIEEGVYEVVIRFKVSRLRPNTPVKVGVWDTPAFWARVFRNKPLMGDPRVLPVAIRAPSDVGPIGGHLPPSEWQEVPRHLLDPKIRPAVVPRPLTAEEVSRVASKPVSARQSPSRRLLPSLGGQSKAGSPAGISSRRAGNRPSLAEIARGLR